MYQLEEAVGIFDIGRKMVDKEGRDSSSNGPNTGNNGSAMVARFIDNFRVGKI